MGYMGNNRNHITSVELAGLLNKSHVAIYKKIISGEIKARKIGRNYVIDKNDLPEILGDTLNEALKKRIDTAVKKVVKEYGEALRRLGKE